MQTIWLALVSCLGGWMWMNPAPASAQAPALETNSTAISRSYVQRHRTREHGLPSNTVRALHQTRDGLVWIGTAAGLARFDGRTFTTFDRQTHPEFSSYDCTALAEDSAGRLWIGTTEGVLWLEQGRLTRSPVNAALTNQWITALCADAAGRVWIGTRRGLYRYEGDRCRFEFSIPVPTNHKSIFCVGEDRAGGIWAGTIAGAFRLRAGASRFEFVPPPGLPKMDFLEGFMVGPDGNPWLQGARLWRMVGDQSALVLGAENLVARFGVVTGTPILTDLSRQIWIAGRDEGLFQLREKQFVAFRFTGLGRPVQVRAMCEDAQGNLWVGTENDGLFTLQPRQFQSLTKADGLPDSDAQAILPARDGGAWIGSRFGLTRWHEGRGVAPTFAAHFARLRVRALHESDDGTLWIATDHTLEHVTGGEVISFPPLLKARLDKVWSITSDAAGNVWAGCVNGLLHWRDGRAQLFTTTNGLPDRDARDVRVVHLDRAGRLWMATAGGGLCWVTPQPVSDSEMFLGPVTTLATTNGLSDNTVRALHEDTNGVLWAGTTHGLNRIELRRSGSNDTVTSVHRFNLRDGLPDALVNGLIGDDLGQLWISGRRGIYRARLSDLNDVAQGRARRADFVAYDESDGILTSETSGFRSHPSSCKTPDGQLWFATPRGVITVDPARLPEPAPPNVLLERVVADGQVLLDYTTREPMLQWPPGGLRSLDIHFTAPEFRAPEKLRFQYRLTGNDRDWIDAGTRRVASYTHLKPGRYRFEVLAARHHGLWSRTSAGFSFHLAPHYWQTWWFWTALAVALAGAIAAAVRWRVREVRRLHALEKEAGVLRERERIAQDMHDDIGARLSQLSMLVDSVADNTPPRADGASLPSLREIVREAAESLDATVWAVKPDNDTLRHLAEYLAAYAHDYLSATTLRLEIDLPREIPAWPIAAEQRHHVFLAAKEALHNAVRHARAQRVLLRLTLMENGFTLEIADDGCGLPPHLLANPQGAASEQDGLRNLRRRAESAGGELRLESAPHQGTRIILSLRRDGVINK